MSAEAGIVAVEGWLANLRDVLTHLNTQEVYCRLALAQLRSASPPTHDQAASLHAARSALQTSETKFNHAFDVVLVQNAQTIDGIHSILAAHCTPPSVTPTPKLDDSKASSKAGVLSDPIKTPPTTSTATSPAQIDKDADDFDTFCTNELLNEPEPKSASGSLTESSAASGAVAPPNASPSPTLIGSSSLAKVATGSSNGSGQATVPILSWEDRYNLIRRANLNLKKMLGVAGARLPYERSDDGVVIQVWRKCDLPRLQPLIEARLASPSLCYLPQTFSTITFEAVPTAYTC